MNYSKIKKTLHKSLCYIGAAINEGQTWKGA